MATNPYFNKFGDKNELNLQEQLFIELVQIKGMDVFYLPKVYLTEDLVMNEIISHYFSKGMMIEMLLESYEDWENNEMEMSNFSLTQMANEAVFVVSKKRFEEVVDEERLTFGKRPNEGDLIYSKNLQEMFVIKKVNKPDPTKAKDRWILKCEKYDENDEDSIDFSNITDETCTFDTTYENGKANYIPIDDGVSEFLDEISKDVDSNYVMDERLSLLENDKKMKQEQLHKTINKENPNNEIINSVKDIIEE